MTLFVCPHCNAKSAFSVVSVQTGGDAPNGLNHVALRCMNHECQRIIGGFVNAADNKTVANWWPKSIGGKAFPDVPSQIASTADEAHRCLSAGAHRGAIALARAVVEATAKDHDITRGMLDKKIEELARLGVISEAMKDAAHEIRFAGNEVAHADLAEEPISKEDAEEVLALMDAILTRVYQEPAQVARVREKREARRSGEA